jgi:hypothetical protein
MSARPIAKSLSFLVVVPFISLIALGAARPAHASDDDPFAGDAPAGAHPAAATAPSGAASAQSHGPPAAPEAPADAEPAIIQELPASAYPESYTRGLYGSSLWLDMQGLQWPYTPHTGIGLSGYGWIDNMYRLVRLGGNQPSDHTTKLFQQGRFLFRVTPTYTNGSWFVQAQAEIVANKDQINTQANGLVDADDVWVRTGVWQQWDLTVGRFQAFDVYPLGMGLDLNSDERLGAYDASNTPPLLYAADFLLYRPSGPGNVAVHVYPTRFLRFELLGQYGNSGSENVVGGRPAVIFDVGWFKLRGAVEYQYEFAQDPSPQSKNTIRNRGGGGSAQFVLAPYLEFGVNAAINVSDVANTQSAGMENLSQSGNKYSFGGFANAAPFHGFLPNFLIGGGANFTSFHDLNVNASTGSYEQSTNLQMFLAVQYLCYKQLFIKAVLGYAKSHFENENTLNPYDDDMYSLRVRLMYLF